jgi:hypothetical protein
MIKTLITVMFVGGSLRAQVAVQPPSRAVGSANPVVQWSRNLVSILRTPGAQPGTIHPTRSFPIMHAAIYDAINAMMYRRTSWTLF